MPAPVLRAPKASIRGQRSRFGHGVIKLKRNDRCIEPGIHRMQHPAGHGHIIVAFQYGRRIGHHDRNRVTPPDAIARQGRGQLT